MESLVSYESDEGDTKITNKVIRTREQKHNQSATISTISAGAQRRKRKESERENESSSSSSSTTTTTTTSSNSNEGTNYDNIRMELSEDDSDPPRDNHNHRSLSPKRSKYSNDGRSDRKQKSSESRSNAKQQGHGHNNGRDTKRKYDGQKDEKKPPHRRDFRDREQRDQSRGEDDRWNRGQNRCRDRKDRSEDRRRCDRKDKQKRKDDRKGEDRHSYKRENDRNDNHGRNDCKQYDRSRGDDRHRDEQNTTRSYSRKRGRHRNGSPKYRFDRDDHSANHNSSVAKSHSDKQSSSSSNYLTHHQDNNSKHFNASTSKAMRQAKALNRLIERRANEKVQQLQKLGIKLPSILQNHQHQQQQLNHPYYQHQQRIQNQLQINLIKPLMAINTDAATLSSFNVPTALAHPNSSSSDDSAAANINITLNMSNFTSPVLVNARYTEQLQKKKLIWGAKKAMAATVDGNEADKITTNNKWEMAKFSQDTDGKVASKFLRLMGMKTVPTSTVSAIDGTSSDESADVDPSVKKREQMFSTMEQQYEIARQATHTMRGMGLGFGSQSRPY